MKLLFVAVASVFLACSIQTGVARNRNNPRRVCTAVAIANRKSDNIELARALSEKVKVVPSPSPSELMYAANPFGEIWVGDRANNQLLIYNSKSNKLTKTVDVNCNGIFHMVTRRILKQIWIVCDIDKTVIVVNTDTKETIQTIPQPAAITAGGSFKPHDVTVGVDFAVVTFLQPGVNVGYIAKFSAIDFSLQVVKRVGGDPHLYTNLLAPSDFVFAALQGSGEVLKMDTNLTTITTLSIKGAHGIFGDFADELLFVTDITEKAGNNALYVIDMATMVIKDVAPTLFDNPHNLAVPDCLGLGSKLFVTHSTPSKVSVYDVDTNGKLSAPRGVPTTGQTPFGIMTIFVDRRPSSSSAKSSSRSHHYSSDDGSS